MTRLAVFLGSFGYVGYFPVAPGTAGSAAGLALFALMKWATGSAPGARLAPGLEVGAIVLLGLAGVWSGNVAERHFGTKDPGQVVLDEVVGMLITLAFMPIGWTAALFGFFVFRVSDIIKPFPASRFERLGGGLGIMADDAMSAVYANLVVRAALWLLPGWFL
jgi:phosphatidylglycerophosphatase A